MRWRRRALLRRYLDYLCIVRLGLPYAQASLQFERFEGVPGFETVLEWHRLYTEGT